MFSAELEAAAHAVETSLPLDGTVALTVVMATSGQGHWDSDSSQHSTYDGPPPFVLNRAVIRTADDRTAAATAIRTFVQPMATFSSGATPPQCAIENRCAPAGGLAWGVHLATEALRHSTANRRELCVFGDLYSDVDPAAGRASETVQIPSAPQARSLNAAIQEAEDAGIERRTFVHRVTPVSVALRNVSRRIVTIHGTAHANGNLAIRVTHGALATTVYSGDIPVLSGDDRYIVARRIAEALASQSSAPITARAHGADVVLELLQTTTFSPVAYPEFDLTDGGVGISFDADVIGAFNVERIEEEAVQVLDAVAPHADVSIVRAFAPETYQAEFGAGFGECLSARVRVRALEVSQGLQDWENFVRLQQGRRTTVRVHTRLGLDSSGLPGAIDSAGVATRLVLRGYRCGGGSGQQCLAPTELGILHGETDDYRTHVVTADPFAEQQRAPVDAPLRGGVWETFVLPPSWRAGRIRLAVERSNGTLDCDSSTVLRQDGSTRCATVVEFREWDGPHFEFNTLRLLWRDNEDPLMAATDAEVFGSQEATRTVIPINFDQAPTAANFVMHAPLFFRSPLPPAEEMVDIADYGTSLDNQTERTARVIEIQNAHLRVVLEGRLALAVLSRGECPDPATCPTRIYHGIVATHPTGVYVSESTVGRGVTVEHIDRNVQPPELIHIAGHLPHAPHELLHALGRLHTHYCRLSSRLGGPFQA